MSLKIKPVGMNVNNINFRKKGSVIKKVSSIDAAYAKELAEIKQRKKDASIIQRLDEKFNYENIKNKIQTSIDSIWNKK